VEEGEAGLEGREESEGGAAKKKLFGRWRWWWWWAIDNKVGKD
jgi:hypothetical protein